MKFIVIEICGQHTKYYGTFYTRTAAQVFVDRCPKDNDVIYYISEIYASRVDGQVNYHIN